MTSERTDALASSHTAVEPVGWLSPSGFTENRQKAEIWERSFGVKSIPLVPLPALTAQAAALAKAERERDVALRLIELSHKVQAVQKEHIRATMAEARAEAAEKRIAELEAGLAFYASKASYADIPLEQWFRDNSGKDATTGYRCGNIDIVAKAGHAIPPIFADLGARARRLTEEKSNGQ